MERKSSFFMWVSVVLFVLATLSSVYFYIQWKRVLTEVSFGATDTAEEIARFTAVISEFVQLPSGEEPTIATVIDAEQLRGQPFFAQAQNGDKVLIYIEARRAILFRPSTHMIIEMTPIFFDETGEMLTIPEIENEDVVTLPTTARVVYYNGSGIQGRAAEFEQLVQSEFTNTETVFITNSFQSYEGIQVVDLSGEHTLQAAQIAEFFGGVVVDFPADESRPDADILIIIGV